MKVGLLAYSTNTGLGVQSYEFYQHMNPDRVMLVDLSSFNHVETHHERYPDAFITTDGFPTNAEIDVFLDGLDVVFVMETPLNYYLFERAEQLGVKTILQYNWEFLDYLQDDKKPKPTMFAAPSAWKYSALPFSNKTRLPVPVARERFKYRKIKMFRNFLHIAGRPAVHDRNGTRDLLFAFHNLPYSGVTLTVKIQDSAQAEEYRDMFKADKRIKIDDTDVLNYWDAYKGFDCLVLPRKYGGLCLPMQEALAQGLPVIMTDVSPNNEFLPLSWVVPVQHSGKFMARTEIDIFTVHQQMLENRLNYLISLPPEHVEKMNKVAHDLGEYLSWDNMKPKYIELFEEVCGEQTTTEA
jgi:glycosyltransferase involved in cell wall biosynthesis